MLECHIVKDLLPNYIDGLLSEKTEREVAQHIEKCGDCKSLYNNMKIPMEETSLKADNEEINFLKKVKAKTVRKLILGIGAILIVFGSLTFFFAIGTPASSFDIEYSTATMPGDKWLVDLQLNNRKALVVRSESIYGLDDEGQKIVVGHVLIPFEVLPSLLIQDEDSFSYGCSFESPPVHDYTVVIRFKDKDVVFSMRDEGLF